MTQQTILIAGGTGLIGTRLAAFFKEKGHTVRILSRSPQGEGQFAWDPLAGSIDDKAVLGADVVINLAGAGIADRRWTTDRKKLLIDSRVKSTAVLRESFQRSGFQPKVYLSASGIGYYGNSGEDWVDESDAPTDDSFLVKCCADWEQAVESIGAMGIRTVVFRTGIVLEKSGGALLEITKPLRFGIGTYFGNGQAWYSWIHLEDVCRMYFWAVENAESEGIYNAVAPQPVRNIEFVKAAAKAMQQAAIFVPAPEFALRLVLGEMADVVFFSNRVSAQKIIQAGFHFQYPVLETALARIFKKHL